MNAYNPTIEQDNIVRMARNLLNNTVKDNGFKIVAFAGGGKTSTMKMIAEDLCSRGLNGMYLAFNRDIADEAKRKMPSGVDSRTFHSLAYVNTPRALTAKMNNRKKFFPKNFEADFLESNFGIKGDTRKYKTKGREFDSIWMSSYRQYIVVKAAMDTFLLDMTERPEARHIMSSCENVLKAKIDDDNKELLASRLLGAVKKLWDRFQDIEDDYAISPNVYLKLWALTKPVIQTDFILFDEAQDSDRLMLDVLSHQKAKVIYVGDPHQQIYEWRGAVNAMNSIRLPQHYLTKSFRFGKDIAVYAGAILKHLGEKNIMTGVDKPSLVDTKTEYPKDINAILCRTNIGVIEAVLEYTIKNNVKVVPSNIDLRDTIQLLHDIEKFRINDESLDVKKHYILSNFRNYEDLQEFCEQSNSDNTIAPTVRLYNEYGYEQICEILDQASKINTKEKDVVVATTAHKSKGLEWEGVYIWSDFRKMMKIEDMEEYINSNGKVDAFSNSRKPINASEARLMYVTMTRAKSRLYAENVRVLVDYLNKKASLDDDKQ